MHDIDQRLVDNCCVNVLICIRQANKDRLSDVVGIGRADFLSQRRIYHDTAENDRVGKCAKRPNLETGGRAEDFLERPVASASDAREVDGGGTPHDGGNHVDQVADDCYRLPGEILVVELGLIRDNLPWNTCKSCNWGQKYGQKCGF